MASLAATAPLLELAAAALQRAALQLLPLHRATAKLGFVVTALLAGVVQEGFCAPPETAEGALPTSGLPFAPLTHGSVVLQEIGLLCCRLYIDTGSQLPNAIGQVPGLAVDNVILYNGRRAHCLPAPPWRFAACRRHGR